MPYNPNLREEELKNTIAQDLFAAFDCTQIIGNIDFAVALKKDKNQTELFDNEYLLWAEAKRGTSDLEKSLTQLILTIGKAKTYAQSAPKFLGCFDAEKIAFIEFYKIQHFFAQNDFNWQVTPSDTTTKEFLAIYQKVQEIIDGVWFRYDDKDLPKFIKQNFVIKKNDISKIKIDKNNFLSIFYKWEKDVFPTIGVELDKLKSENVISGDFYLADLLSDGNKTIVEKLSVLLKEDLYKLQKEDNIGLIFREIRFRDNQKAHTQFWNRYERPPKEEYQEYIRTRRDLLVPVDIRERKGAFFTPQIWVEKSQQYLAQTLGENWQEDHYIWDCCAGTGNLLFGLTNKRHIYASTLDDQDVNIMKQNANLFEDHVFQFDFLNDDFSRLPEGLRQIIADPEKRKKLVLYINPPYAEAGDAKQIAGTGKNKDKVAITTQIYDRYKPLIGKAAVELFAQFFIRIHQEIPGCTLAEFSTLKILQASNFAVFRSVFRAKLEKLFLVPAKTFDNVSGAFPIGFFIWNTREKETFKQINADVFDADGNFFGSKNVISTDDYQTIGKWLVQFKDKDNMPLGMINSGRLDFQNQKFVHIANEVSDKAHALTLTLTLTNLLPVSVFFAVRHCIEATWLNDRDQFLFPNDGWKSDREFQTDCLIFTLFHGQNRITSEQGTNHWIPFSETELGARKAFKSDFMVRFLCGKIKPSNQPSGFLDFESNPSDEPFAPLDHLSNEANDLLAAGKALWKYYFEQPVNNVDASLYDIRKYFQGVNHKNGRMNASSTDEHYNNLRQQLSKALKNLANKISQKVFLYGFLK